MTETENAADAVRKQALDMLARREHSGAELRAKLTAKGFPSNIISAALMELRQSGWLDDARFAEAFIRARSDRGYGPSRIRAELKERGVDDELIASHLDAHDPSWILRLHSVWNKRYAAKRPRSYAEKARQMRFLQSRGFTVEQIHSVIDGGLDEE